MLDRRDGIGHLDRVVLGMRPREAHEPDLVRLAEMNDEPASPKTVITLDRS